MDLSLFRLKSTVMVLLLASSVGGCATTQIEKAWVEPTATAQSFELKKVLVIALARDGAIRRSTEDALDRAISSGPRGQSGSLVVDPSYELLDTTELSDVATARKKVEAAGYDGAVLIRYVSSEKEVTIEPPTYRGGFWGGYGYGGGAGGMMYAPGTVRTDTILKLQIDIYSLAAEKLLWSGVSRTLNPRDLDELIDDIAKAVRADLQKRGFAP
jgi:hypothetical protein